MTARLADLGGTWTVVATRDPAALHFSWVWRLSRSEQSAFHLAFEAGALLKAQRKAAGGVGRAGGEAGGRCEAGMTKRRTTCPCGSRFYVTSPDLALCQVCRTPANQVSRPPHGGYRRDGAVWTPLVPGRS